MCQLAMIEKLKIEEYFDHFVSLGFEKLRIWMWMTMIEQVSTDFMKDEDREKYSKNLNAKNHRETREQIIRRPVRQRKCF